MELQSFIFPRFLDGGVVLHGWGLCDESPGPGDMICSNQDLLLAGVRKQGSCSDRVADHVALHDVAGEWSAEFNL